MSTWQERLKVALGPRGYDGSMRRSMQTVLLYEAMRCVESTHQKLRPFQRKLAHLDQMKGLLESLTFILPHQKVEIMWRTGTSKEPLTPDIAWKRCKAIDLELRKIANALRPFIIAGKTHDETVNTLVQSLFENLIKFPGRPHPEHWEHAHNHYMMAFRMYYRYDQLDPSFPPPVMPCAIVVPMSREKPAPIHVSRPDSHFVGGDRDHGVRPDFERTPSNKKLPPTGIHFGDDSSAHGVQMLLNESTVTAKMPARPPTDEHRMSERRMALQEVREHLELLREFEGVVSDEELASRKRELFLALPPAPSASNAAKKYKVDSNEEGG